MGDGGLIMEAGLCSIGLVVFGELVRSVYAYLLVGSWEADCPLFHWEGYSQGLISIN